MAAVPSTVQFHMQPENKPLKYRISLKILSGLILSLGIVCINFEIAFKIIAALYGSQTSPVATGIWGGVLGVICGGLGLGAFRKREAHKCLMISHFVLAILVAIVDVSLTVEKGILIGQLPRVNSDTMRYSPDSNSYIRTERSESEKQMLRGAYGTSAILLLAGIVQFLCCIVSTAFVCRNWGCGPAAPVTVVYLASVPTDPGIETTNVSIVKEPAKPGVHIAATP